MPRPFFLTLVPLLVASALLPAPVARAEPPAALYNIDNHAGTITVTSRAGETLFTGKLATPTALVVITHGPDTDAPAAPNSPLFLTLEDTHHVHLWQKQTAETSRLSWQTGPGSDNFYTKFSLSIPPPSTLTAHIPTTPLRVVAEVSSDDKVIASTSTPGAQTTLLDTNAFPKTPPMRYRLLRPTSGFGTAVKDTFIAPPPAATYIVNNHAGKVTITNASGKTLYAGQAATPAVQMIITCGPEGVPNFSADRTAYLALEDNKGNHLWALHVPTGPYISFNLEPGKARQGVKFMFTSRAEPPNKGTLFFSQRGTFIVGKSDTLTALTTDGTPQNITSESSGYVFDSLIVTSRRRLDMKPKQAPAGFGTPIEDTFIAPSTKNIVINPNAPAPAK